MDELTPTTLLCRPHVIKGNHCLLFLAGTSIWAASPFKAKSLYAYTAINSTGLNVIASALQNAPSNGYIQLHVYGVSDWTALHGWQQQALYSCCACVNAANVPRSLTCASAMAQYRHQHCTFHWDKAWTVHWPSLFDGSSTAVRVDVWHKGRCSQPRAVLRP